MLKIKDWPKEERPRERLLKNGAESLSDAQLLAILLRTGSDKGDALQLAIYLLKKFSPLPQFFQATISELCAVKGIGPAKAAQLKAALELGRRSLSIPLFEGAIFSKSRDVFQHFAPLFRNAKKEYFKILLLDQKNKLIRDVTISEGSLTATVVHPREVFRPAIRDSAAAVIFIHNHPSGNPSPSTEDKNITTRLSKVGEVMGIPVLDHLIIGDRDYFSFADAGYIRHQQQGISVADQNEVVYS
ncbi:MAG: DNA repair protein RadC [Nitrospirota bacterium]|nr:DNA repair protein RadC [Nitrospirota bacterium]